MAELTPDRVLQGIKTWAEAQYQSAGQQVDVALHGGRFSQADLDRYATRDSACRLALEGLKYELNGQGRLIVSGQAVAVLLAGDQGAKDSRALNVLRLVGTLSAALPGSHLELALEASINAKDLRAANLYHAELDKRGTAAWVLTWPVKFNHPRHR